MGRAKPKTRQVQIKIKQKRNQKLRKLKEKYLNTSKKTEKNNILDKMKRVAPHLNIDEYIGQKSE